MSLDRNSMGMDESQRRHKHSVSGDLEPGVAMKQAAEEAEEYTKSNEELESFRKQIHPDQQRYAQLLELASDAYLVTDPAGVILEANSHAATLFNVPRNMLLGIPVVQFITDETRRDLPEDFQGALPYPTIGVFEPEIQSKDGQPFPCLVKVTALAGLTDGQARFIWLIRNLKEHKAIEPRVQALEENLHALFDLALEFGSDPNVMGRLQSVAERVKALLKPESLVIYLYVPEQSALELEIVKGLPTIPGTRLQLGEGIVGMVAQDRQPRLVENHRTWPFQAPQVEDQPITAAAVPMLCFDELIGVMAIAEIGKTTRRFTWNDVRLLSIFAALAGSIVYNARASETMKEEIERRKQAENKMRIALKKIRSLSVRVEEIREEERTELARQIHDELGQLLTGFKMGLASLAKNQEEVLEKSQSLMQLSDSTIASVQRISTDLRPGVLDELGLEGALKWQTQDFQERSGIECEIDLRLDDRNLDRNLATAVFRIFQEILTNVARHAHASRIHIECKEEKGNLLLHVEDNGRGITEDQISSPKSLGLVGIRERAQAFGGKVTITGSEGQGTTIVVTLPRRSRPIEETST